MFKSDKIKEQYERIEEQCRLKGVTKYDMVLALGKSKSIITDVLAGRNGFSVATLQAFADYLGCSVGYLINGETSETPMPVTEQDIKIALFGGEGEVTDEMWREALDAIEYIKFKHGKKNK